MQAIMTHAPTTWLISLAKVNLFTLNLKYFGRGSRLSQITWNLEGDFLVLEVPPHV